MRLSDGWMFQFVRYEDGGKSLPKVATAQEADGVMFTCPLCASDSVDTSDGKRSGHVVLCWFVGKVPTDASPGPGRWTFSGSTIEDLTLNPSVFLNGVGCGWHGWVKNGDAS
jgi:hypothetical protein